MSDPPCWPWATPAQDFDMADEPRMSVLSSSTLRYSYSVTNRRRGGGSLGTDFSAACAPDSPATYVLVLGLPSGSPTPCGVSKGKEVSSGPLSSGHDTFLFPSLRDLSRVLRVERIPSIFTRKDHFLPQCRLYRDGIGLGSHRAVA